MSVSRIRALQIAVAIGGLIPVAAGLAGVLLGPRMAEAGVSASLQGAILPR